MNKSKISSHAQKSHERYLESVKRYINILCLKETIKIHIKIGRKDIPEIHQDLRDTKILENAVKNIV